MSGRRAGEFERVYRANVAAVTAYFARRCGEPQTVADLTSETFARAVGSFCSFDAGKGTARSWLFGIATHVYAQHCEQTAGGRDAAARLAGRRALEVDEIEELAARIDAEQAGRALIARCSQLPDLERTAVELVDLTGLTPKEAAAALGVSRGVLRARAFRARARLRREHAIVSTFEDNLWRELVREHHAEHAHPGRASTGGLARRRRLAGASMGLAAVGTAAALALTAGTAAPAFAVTSNPNGTVTVTINQIAGIAGANAKLAALGVRARAVPIVQGCTAALLRIPKVLPNGPPPPTTVSAPQSGLPQSMTFEPSEIPAGDTLVLAAKQLVNGPANGIQMLDAIVRGSAPACVAQAPGGKQLPKTGGGSAITG